MADFPRSWNEVQNAYVWETIRAEFWRKQNEPGKADYVQAMADAFYCELIQHQFEVQ